MGSKSHLINRLRQNDAFVTAVKVLDENKLPYEVCPPTGKGHPYLIITMPDGKPIKYHVASSPRSKIPIAKARTMLVNALKNAGYDVG